MSDDWDFYSLRVDSQPASIFVDLGMSKEAPIRSHSTMGYLRVLMRLPREDGLSSREEFDDLIALEDRVTAKVIQDGTAVFVGRNTSSGNRDFYFYVADPTKFEKAAKAAMREFPAYKYETDARADQEWRTYFDFLYPSEIDYQRIMNRRVRQHLKKTATTRATSARLITLLCFRTRRRKLHLQVTFRPRGSSSRAPPTSRTPMANSASNSPE